MCFTSSGNFPHDVVYEKLYCKDSDFIISPIPLPPVTWSPTGAIAPSIKLFFESGIILSISSSVWVPSPSHLGHAPWGELNEKLVGSNNS